jgi:hypothetical protein
MQLEVIVEVNVGSPIRQLRAAPVCMGHDQEEAVIAIHSSEGNIDPWHQVFRFPSDTYKLTLFNKQGQILWQRELGKGIIPGVWFCPVFPFDMDGDGVDEIWLLTNSNEDHPLRMSDYMLERINALTGETMGQWPWPSSRKGYISMSDSYRNFIFGGFVQGEPVLVTAQGTYGSMHLQAWNKDMTERWEHRIPMDAEGARGSHMCSVLDINGDSVDEIIWGERCIELDRGIELFCADREVWKGHSNIVQPTWDMENDRWYLFTARESFLDQAPRLVMFDDQGKRKWAHVDTGLMYTGWVARLGDGFRQIALATRIGPGKVQKVKHYADQFVFDALTGEPVELSFPVLNTHAVDLNGDGYHELIRPDGAVLDRHGNIIANIGSPPSCYTKLWNLLGEQLISTAGDGRIIVWADRTASDNSVALKRFNHPFYKINRKVLAVGYNGKVLCGV